MKKKSALFLLSVIIFLFAFGIFTRNHATLSSIRDTSSGPSAFSPSRSSITQQSESDTPPGGISYPVSVNLQDIAPNQYDPNNQYDRWQRGETQLDRGEHIVDPLRIAEMRLNALRLPTGKVDIASSAGPGQFAPTLVSGFDSIDQPECCGGGSNVPPDPEIAVGQNHVIAVVNVAFEIYDKNGTSVVGPTTFASLFNSVSSCTNLFDPNAVYDEAANRYILGIDADGTDYCIAVSQTSDPTGSWWIYSFVTGTGNEFFDYPHAGVGRDAIYMGANIFTNIFLESRIYAFDKTAMYSGNPATYVTRSLPSQYDTPQPLNLHGFEQGTWPDSGPHYFFMDNGFNGSTYSVYSWDAPFGANSLSLVGTVDLTSETGVPATMPIAVPQNGGVTIEGNDFRPQDFEYRNGYAWTAMTIACNPGSGTVNCVRWAQIDPATATVVDAGVYSSNGEFRIFPDLAVDACGNMAIGYTKSSSSMFPGVYYSGRLASDAAGDLQAESLLKAGEIRYAAFDGAPLRWGDYTEMTISPDGTTFWYLGEYSKNISGSNANWGTYIGSFTYDCSLTPDFTIHADPDLLAICIPENVQTTVNVQSTFGFSETVDLSASGVPAGYEAVFTPASDTSGFSSTLDFNHISAAAPGLYDVVVSGISVSGTHTTTVSLQLDEVAPGMTMLTTPASGSPSTAIIPNFEWLPVVGASSYLIEVAADSAFSNIVISDNTATPSYTPVNPLDPATTYYWRVTSQNNCGTGPVSSTAHFTTVAKFCSATVTPFTDGNTTGVTNQITIPASGVIEDLNVFINATHTWVGDLIFTVTNDSTTTSVTIIDRPGVPASLFGCSNNNILATLDDEAAIPVEGQCETASPAINGVFSPNNPLSAFDGESLQGTWTIRAIDPVSPDSGQLNEWCIEPVLANPADASIQIVHDASPSDGTDFEFTTNALPSGSNTFFLDDALPDDSDGITNTRVINGLLPGIYTISVTLPLGWEQSSLVCDAGSWDAGSSTATVNLAVSEVVSCTFVHQTSPTAVGLLRLAAKTSGLTNQAIWLGVAAVLSVSAWLLRQQKRRRLKNQV